MMKQIKNKPWFLFLLVVFFILHGVVENFGFIYLEEILKISITISFCVALLYFTIKLFIKNSVHAALICFFISSWLLFFGDILDRVKSVHLLHWLHSYTVFVPFMLCTFLLFILFIRKKNSLQHKLCFYLNILLLVYCIYDLSALTLKSIRASHPIQPVGINFDGAKVKTKPNVYLLLFDEYPGYKSLRDSFAFSNDSLYQFLLQKEFKQLPTFSNYNMTFYSMASMLNMEYINKPYKPLENTMENDQTRIKEIKNARVIEYFKLMGYSFTNYSVFDILNKPAVKGNSFIISQATLITHKIFFNKILSDVGWHFISGRFKMDFIKNIYMQDDRNNKFIENKIMEIKPGSIASPQFIYAHFILPHPPIFCDSLGNYLPTQQIFDPVSYTNKPTFLSYLKYCNKVIKNLINALCKNDANAIIVVMSDHGYRAYNNLQLIEPMHFDNICAVRFPDKNYLSVKERWSNVNFFRYVFNCEFNQNIPYLSDSSIFLKDIKPDAFAP